MAFTKAEARAQAATWRHAIEVQRPHDMKHSKSNKCMGYIRSSVYVQVHQAGQQGARCERFSGGGLVVRLLVGGMGSRQGRGFRVEGSGCGVWGFD